MNEMLSCVFSKSPESILGTLCSEKFPLRSYYIRMPRLFVGGFYVSVLIAMLIRHKICADEPRLRTILLLFH